SRRRHTRFSRDWSSDVCSSDLVKLGETILHSSWMVALLALPLLAAYAVAWDGGWLFPFVALGAILPLFVIPGVVGTAITLLLVNIFPARRTRDLLGLVTILAAGGLVLMLRLLRPEQLEIGRAHV